MIKHVSLKVISQIPIKKEKDKVKMIIQSVIDAVQ